MRSFLSRNLLALGLVSLFTDTASEMVIPLLPVLLTSSLGASAAVLGLIEGIAEAVAAVLKLYSGRLADRTGKSKPLVIAGYCLSSLAKPMLAFATISAHVLLVRIVDRIGKGIRTSPRDALLAASVPPEARGRAFGFHRAMDHVGAIIGPAIAFLLLHHHGLPLAGVFLWSAVPGVIVVLLTIFAVEERAAAETRPPPPKLALPRGPLLRFLIPIAIFALGNASDTFLLLKAKEAGAELYSLPLLWAGLHVTKATVSFLGGAVSDRIGARRTIALGWLSYAAIYAAFAFATDTTMIVALFIAYGVFHGLTEGPERALVAAIAGERERGSAFGFYHLTIGLLAIPAGLLFGGLWDLAGARIAFLTGAGFAIAAIAALFALGPRR